MPTKNLFRQGNVLIGAVFVVVALTVLGVSLFLANKKFGSFILSSSASANSAILTLAPSALTLKPNDSQTLGVTINSQSNYVSAVELNVNFNPQVVTVDAITTGPFFPSPITLSPLKISSGKATIVFGNTPSSQIRGITGSNILANVKFHALAAGSFSFTTAGSKVASIGQTANVYESGGDSVITVSAPVTTQNPIGYWKFDETSGSSALDSSGNNGNGTAIGTIIVAGKVNNARSFNGTSDVVTVPNSANLNPPALTISAWIKPVAYSYGNFVNKGDNSGYRFRILTNGALQFLDRAGVNALATSTTVPLNTWSHVAVTADASGTKMYINGSLAAQRTGAYGAPITSTAMEIGADRAYVEYFKGQIDEVRIYKIALSAAEIANLYNTGQ